MITNIEKGISRSISFGAATSKQSLLQSSKVIMSPFSVESYRSSFGEINLVSLIKKFMCSIKKHILLLVDHIKRNIN